MGVVSATGGIISRALSEKLAQRLNFYPFVFLLFFCYILKAFCLVLRSLAKECACSSPVAEQSSLRGPDG